MLSVKTSALLPADSKLELDFGRNWHLKAQPYLTCMVFTVEIVNQDNYVKNILGFMTRVQNVVQMI